MQDLRSLNREEESRVRDAMSSLTDVKRLHEKLDHFYAGGYLATWCDGSVRAEWAGFLHEVFSGGGGISVGGKGTAAPVVLDVGCGPSICNVISGDPPYAV